MIALLPWRWAARYLAWRGHSVPHIAVLTGRTMNEVDRAIRGKK